MQNEPGALRLLHFTFSVWSTVIKSTASSTLFLLILSSRRAHRLYVQQQLLWQFGVQRRGHPSPSRTPQAGLWPLVVQFLLWEAARDDPTDGGGAAEGGGPRYGDEWSDHLRCQGDGDATPGE